jgi:hypothetical protein
MRRKNETSLNMPYHTDCRNLNRFPRTWEANFPGDDVGWVTIQFNNPSCPQLHTKGVFWIVEIPKENSTCTSTPFPRGLKYFRFEARQGEAMRPLKWGDSVWPATYKKDSGWYLIFVGNKEKFNHSGSMPRP